jgi:Ca2+/Na+ antiporter
MKNPLRLLDYFYYKVRKSENDFFTARIVQADLFFNIITVYILVIQVWDFVVVVGIITFILLTIFLLFYFTKARKKEIIARYENESEEERKKGNIWVAVYRIGSTIAFFGAIYFVYIR